MWRSIVSLLVRKDIVLVLSAIIFPHYNGVTPPMVPPSMKAFEIFLLTLVI